MKKLELSVINEGYFQVPVNRRETYKRNGEGASEDYGMTYETYDSEKDPSGQIGMALAEQRYQRNKVETFFNEIDEMNKREKYASFLRKSRNVSSHEGMKRLLLRYFPGRFGSDGQQPIEGYPGTKIYGLYNAMIRSSRNFLAGLGN